MDMQKKGDAGGLDGRNLEEIGGEKGGSMPMRLQVMELDNLVPFVQCESPVLDSSK